MSLSINAMCDAIRLVAGDDESDLPNTGTNGAVSYINKSLWELMDKLPFREKEHTVYFNTTAGEYSYTTPEPFEALRSISVTDKYGKRIPLINRDLQDFEGEFREMTETEEQGIPEYYRREHDCIQLQPVPDDVYKITLRYLRGVEDVAAGELSPDLPKHMQEILELGAKYRRLLDKGQVAKAMGFKNLQDHMLATWKPQEAKETIDSRFAGLQAIRPEYLLR